jgi:thioredoxin reductase
MARIDPPQRVAVLGAGPVGLEATLYAKILGLPVTLYDSGRVGEHLRQWGHVKMFSPFAMNTTSLGRVRIKTDYSEHNFPADTALLTGREHVDAYLEPLSATEAFKGIVRLQTRVLAVGRGGIRKEEEPGSAARGKHPFRLLLRNEKGEERVEEADVVLDCTGTYGKPRWLGDGGIPAIGEIAARPQIAHGLEDILGEKKPHYADKTTLVIGAGYSAATTVASLAALAEKYTGTWVHWLARATRTQPIRRFVNDTLRERDQVAVRANTLATRADGCVEFHPGTLVDAVEFRGADKGFLVRARRSGKPVTWEAERIIANVGYSPNTELYRELQVHECYASLGPMALAASLMKHTSGDCMTIPTQGAATLRTPEPNFYILGAKSYGRNSNFLLRNGFEQVREVFTLIMGKMDLDLYKKK